MGQLVTPPAEQGMKNVRYFNYTVQLDNYDPQRIPLHRGRGRLYDTDTVIGAVELLYGDRLYARGGQKIGIILDGASPTPVVRYLAGIHLAGDTAHFKLWFHPFPPCDGTDGAWRLGPTKFFHLVATIDPA